MPGAMDVRPRRRRNKRANLMQRAFLLLIPAAAAFAASGCVVGSASGAPYSESLRSTYTGFEKVDVSAGVEVIVAQGNFDVKADGSSDDLKNLIVEVQGKTLRIGRKQTMMMGWGGGPRYRVTVSAPAYSAFEVSSGASIDGASLQLADLEIDVSSGASIELAGACKTLRVDISSGAQFDGEGLKCETAKIDASSGAHVEAFAANTAEGNASSGASVSFHGHPPVLEKDESSGGSVDAR
jgi:hypothetical protein